MFRRSNIVTLRSLDAYEFELIGWSVPIVEKELFAKLDVPFGENSDPMIAIHQHDSCVAVGIDRMVGEPNFVSFSLRIYDKVVVQVEQK